jgi:streptogramin lyase
MPAITEAQVVRGVAFDGKYLWTHGGFNQLFKLDPETGRSLSGWKGLSVSGTHRFIVSLAWDGQYLWTMDQVGDRKVHAVDPSTGRTVRTLSLPQGTSYGSLDYGEGGLWVVVGDAEKKEGSICKLDPRTGAVLRSVPCPAGCGNATYCDGALWVTDKETIRKLSAADGRVLASFVAPGLPVGPWDACMDGAGGLWVADPFNHTLRLYSPEPGGDRRP